MNNNQPTAVDVRAVSKSYSINSTLAQRTLIDSLATAGRSLGEALRSPKAFLSRNVQEFWALRDISFQVAQGEIVGIIGDNGAGKSTLLKILSRITEPTSGAVTYSGRVGSLLEVGTGFHPELTGRDNIFLNGAILGMSRRDIIRHFDEIVAFAGVERFIDTPVKRYSSGMYLRLAFAVAAHLDAEILLIDEVLAVGDVNFQKKCLARMGEVTRDGRTILFVSHNLPAIKSICHRTLVLDGGRLAADGNTNQVLAEYLKTKAAANDMATERRWTESDAPASEAVRIISASVYPVCGTPNASIDVSTSFLIECKYRSLVSSVPLSITISMHDAQGLLLFAIDPAEPPLPRPAGAYRSSCLVPGNLLNDGSYTITLVFHDGSRILLELPYIIRINILDSDDGRSGWFGKWEGILRPHFSLKTEALEVPTVPPESEIRYQPSR
jgi:lipopolysaccharide transport system ATP-binding protein